MTHCTCHPGKTCASAASCAAARKTEFGEKMSTEQKLREALEELLYAHTDKAVAMARAALSLPATEKASAEQEPVGYVNRACMERARDSIKANGPVRRFSIVDIQTPFFDTPVYVAPVSQPAPLPGLSEADRKDAERRKAWPDAANWLRNNYQDHPNIASLCDAMREEGSKGQQ